jgi:hypothetical protein
MRQGWMRLLMVIGAIAVAKLVAEDAVEAPAAPPLYSKHGAGRLPG